MNGLTLKHLRYFDALARQGHFGRAAEDCGISQPALSVQIRDLEAMLGAALVERGARTLRLTALGEAFLDRARRILVEVDGLAALKRAAEGPLAGPFRLGVIPTVAPYLLPQMMAVLAERMPALDLAPREAITPSLVADLVAARLDAAVLALPISEPALEEMPLFEEEFMLVRAQGEADAAVPAPEDLQAMRLLLLEEGHCFRDQALSFCKIGPAAPKIVMEGSSLSTLVQMVGAGLGLTLLPQMALPLETRGAAVSVARFAPPAPSRQIGMVWRRSNPLGERLREVGEIVRQLGRAALD